MKLRAYIVIILADLGVSSRYYFRFCWSAQLRFYHFREEQGILAGLLIALEILGTLARFAFVVCFGAWGGLMFPET